MSKESVAAVLCFLEQEQVCRVCVSSVRVCV
jgi:hypothetical protein